MHGGILQTREVQRRALHSFQLQTTGETDQALEATARTAQPDEAPAEQTAVQISAELALNEARLTLTVAQTMSGLFVSDSSFDKVQRFTTLGKPALTSSSADHVRL